MKQCPYCAEEIQDAAVKCRYCGEFLQEAPKEEKAPWYFKTSFVVLCFLMTGPLALPLVWLHPRYSRFQKLLITVLVTVLTCFLGAAVIHSVKSIIAYYKQVSTMMV